MTKKYLIVTGDTNDADYTSKKTLITDAKLERLKPLFEALKNCKADYNWGINEYIDMKDSTHSTYVKTGILTEKQLDYFQGFIPYDIHTITKIEVIEVVSEEVLFKGR